MKKSHEYPVRGRDMCHVSLKIIVELFEKLTSAINSKLNEKNRMITYE